MRNSSSDKRVVLTLDAGGTSFRFFAWRGHQPVTETVVVPSCGNNLKQSLANIVAGFSHIKQKCPTPPVAISFAFPGPADYPNGVIGDLGNLPAYRGGVALGPLLEQKFGLPVFINNDGDLFAYGEAIAGFLPRVNALLEKAGSPRRYKNLLGLTLGTGFGGGLVRDGNLFIGDNAIAGEVWLLRNKLQPSTNAEEGASIRAVRRAFAKETRMPLENAPDPKAIFKIGCGKTPGNRRAAREAYRQLGEVVGDAMAQALTLIDGVAVIGGGIASAWPLFLPAVVDELNGAYVSPDGKKLRRLIPEAFNMEDAGQRKKFLKGGTQEIVIPGTRKKVPYNCEPRIAVGVTRLGTSQAVAVGACAFALNKLDQGR